MLSNAAIFVALFYFVCAPTLDSIAKEDTLNASPNLLERVIAAFDVIDDITDHFAPEKPAVEQHQAMAPILPASDPPLPVLVRAVRPADWNWGLPLPPPAASPSVPSPPPRA